MGKTSCRDSVPPLSLRTWEFWNMIQISNGWGHSQTILAPPCPHISKPIMPLTVPKVLTHFSINLDTMGIQVLGKYSHSKWEKLAETKGLQGLAVQKFQWESNFLSSKMTPLAQVSHPGHADAITPVLCNAAPPGCFQAALVSWLSGTGTSSLCGSLFWVPEDGSPSLTTPLGNAPVEDCVGLNPTFHLGENLTPTANFCRHIQALCIF